MDVAKQSEVLSYPFNDGNGLDVAKPYRQAQEQGLVRVQLPHGEPAWLATRYDDARVVFADRRFSRALAGKNDEPRYTPSVGGSDVGLISMDPPDHTRIRSLVRGVFSPRQAESSRSHVREICHGLLDMFLAEGAPNDLVDKFALSLPITVICGILGVPARDRPVFRQWTDILVSSDIATPAEQATVLGSLRRYMGDLIEARHAHPENDLLSQLVAQRGGEPGLSSEELVDLCLALLIAGHETTASEIPNFVYTLLLDRPQWERLVADPGLIPAAVEELLRFVPLELGAMYPRYATEDVQLGDCLVKAGEAVLIAFSAANRDPRQFAEPDVLDFDRGNSNRHLGFGHGMHLCIGMHIARIELQEALAALTEKAPGLRLAEPIEWKPNALLRGPKRMVVTW
jgi:cytochrome P450